MAHLNPRNEVQEYCQKTWGGALPRYEMDTRIDKHTAQPQFCSRLTLPDHSTFKGPWKFNKKEAEKAVAEMAMDHIERSSRPSIQNYASTPSYAATPSPPVGNLIDLDLDISPLAIVPSTGKRATGVIPDLPKSAGTYILVDCDNIPTEHIVRCRPGPRATIICFVSNFSTRYHDEFGHQTIKLKAEALVKEGVDTMMVLYAGQLCAQGARKIIVVTKDHFGAALRVCLPHLPWAKGVEAYHVPSMAEAMEKV